MRTSRPISLRTKLSLIFVCLAVVPCLSLTLLVSRQLTRAIEFWGNPGLQRSFSSSVAVARESMGLLEVHLAATVQRAALDGEPEHTDLDIWRIYAWRDDAYVLEAAEASETGLILDSPHIEAALHEGPDRIFRLADGWLLAVVPIDSAAVRVLLGGYRVSDEFTSQIEAARRGAQHIGELSLYKAVYKGWVWVSAFVVSVLVVGGSIVLARRLARGLTRPIEEIVEAMGRLGRGGQVAALQLPADREMAYLVRSFNAMSDELDRSRRQLQRAERLAAWRDIARRVAHEIKNPLTPIQFAIHRLKKRLAGEADPGAGSGPGPDGQRSDINESLDSILGEVETLRAIADSFSQLAKLPDPQLDRLQVADLLREVAGLYQQPGVEQRHLIEPSLPEIRGDRRQLRQVFNNLIQNAVEAMPDGGQLTISATATSHPAGLRVEISNSVGSIATDRLDRIWEPYFTTKQTGTGLGLAVVGKIVSDHEGHIELDNLPGGGVVARLSLPVAASDPAATAADVVSA